MINLSSIFPSSVGILDGSKFLKVARDSSYKAIDNALKKYNVDPVHPLIQTENMVWDPLLTELNNFILNSTNKMLDQQGYDVSKVRLSLNDLWCQKHFKTSGHERHIHNNGAVMSGFFMIECPQNSSFLMLYDPRPGKEYGFVLPEKNQKNMSEASSIINYGPSEGELILVNSYIPHGFSRNQSDNPFTFLHFNVYATWAEQTLDTKTNHFVNKAIVI